MTNQRPEGEPVTLRGLPRGGIVTPNVDTLIQPQLGAAAGMLAEAFESSALVYFPDTRPGEANLYIKIGDPRSFRTLLLRNNPKDKTTTIKYVSPNLEVNIAVTPKNKQSPYDIQVTHPEFGTQANTPLAARLAIIGLIDFQTGQIPKRDYEEITDIFKP